jgi:transcriptional regulator with XRE-family HTH domain
VIAVAYYPRIKDLREDFDLTQKKLAEVLGTTQQQYSKYENGLQEIPAHQLVKLADFYRVSVDYILGRTTKLD